MPAFSARLCLPILIAALAVGPARAVANHPSTLDHIRETGVLRAGYAYAPPFAYADGDGAAIGYAIELCGRLAESLRARLGLPKLEVQYRQIAVDTRIQQLDSGRIDIECGANTNVPERLGKVAFSPSYFLVESRYVALSGNALRTIDDLRGKSVAVVLGTTNVGDIARLNRERRLNLSVVLSRSLEDAFRQVTEGKVSAFPMDDVLLRMLIGSTSYPEHYRLSEDALAPPQGYGFMMRRGDEAFVRTVDAALREIYASPDMQALYDRWFNAPLPGSGVNLRMPMSPALRRALLEQQ